MGECSNFIDTHICYSNLKILNVGQLRDHQLLTLVYQFLNGVSPACFLDIFSTYSDYHSYHTRNADKLVSEIINIVRSVHVFRHVSVSLWNSLPDSIMDSESVSPFKSQVKKFLLGRDTG